MSVDRALALVATLVAAAACDDWERLSVFYETAGSGAGLGVGGSGGDCASPPAAPCPADAYVCDGFEGVGLATYWGTNEISGTVRLADAPACGHGARSLHLHTEEVMGSAGAQARLKKDLDGTTPEDVAVRTHQYGRAFLYFQSPSFSPDTIVWLMQLTPVGSGQSFFIRLVNGYLSVHDDFLTVPEHGTSVLIAPDRWICLSWEAEAAVGGTVVVRYADGIEPERTIWEGAFADATLPALPDRIFLGVGVVPEGLQSALDVWLDDVALDDTPVHCSD